MIHKLIYDVYEVDRAARMVIAMLSHVRVVTIVGSLGAGKTTLMQSIMQQLGVTDLVTSPTFSYVQTYTGADQKRYHHFDLYRLDSLEEFFAAGFEEYLNDGAACSFIEWPEIVQPLVKNIPRLEMRLDYDGINKRSMILTYTKE